MAYFNKWCAHINYLHAPQKEHDRGKFESTEIFPEIEPL
jgi:hypothetical protein